MTPKLQKMGMSVAGMVALIAFQSQVLAGGHTWRIKEVFSNASGTVQFIEAVETCGGAGEIATAGHQITANANSVNITSNISGSAAGRHILIGTANLTSFGGPAPDYIIPANFISLAGVTVGYSGLHSCVIGSGVIPTNGTNSLNRPTACGGASCPTTVALNSPTNLAGASSPVNAPACMDVDGDGYGSPGDAACPNGAATDCNDGNNAINPGATEVCNDGIDNDCDGNIDLLDSMCIPTVSQWGVIVMATLLLVAGTLITTRPKARTA